MADHHLEARIDRLKADLKASRKHLQADAEKLWAHGRAWWKEADKRTIAVAAVGAGIVIAGAAWWMARDSQ